MKGRLIKAKSTPLFYSTFSLCGAGTYTIQINLISLYAKIGTMKLLNEIQRVYNSLTSQRFQENYFLPFNGHYTSFINMPL